MLRFVILKYANYYLQLNWKLFIFSLADIAQEF